MNDGLFLDTNALLNAAYLPSSWSALAIGLARENGILLYSGEETVEEARAKLRKRSIELGVRVDYVRIDRLLAAFGVQLLQADPDTHVPAAIPKHDRHVYCEAATAPSACVLTTDRGLWLGCRAVGMPAVFPMEVMRHFRPDDLRAVIFGVVPAADRGQLFVRVMPGAWAGRVREGRFTVIDCAGVAWIYYDAKAGLWAAEVGCLRQRLEVPAPLHEGVFTAVSLSWLEGQWQLRVQGAERPATNSALIHQLMRITGRAAIGHRLDGTCHWNGHVYCCVSDDRPLGRKSWPKLQQHPDLTPNPYDSDRLDAALIMLDSSHAERPRIVRGS